MKDGNENYEIFSLNYTDKFIRTNVVLPTHRGIQNIVDPLHLLVLG